MAVLGVHVWILVVLVHLARCNNSGDGWSLHDYPSYYDPDYNYQYDDCTFEETLGYAVYGRNDATLVDTTVEHCKDACLTVTTFICASFDYNVETRSCFLSIENSESDNYGPHLNSIHYDKSCETIVDRDRQPFETRHLAGTVIYEDGHCFTRFGPIGFDKRTEHYPEVSDRKIAHGHNITRIKIEFDGHIDSIQLTYGTESSERIHYINGESRHVFEQELEADEYITGVSGVYSDRFDWMQFTTNKRELGPFAGNHADWGLEFYINGEGKYLAFMGRKQDVTNLYGISVLNFYFSC